MVPISEIRAQNAAFAAQKQINKVCVFVGATSGIGDATLDIVASLLVKPTIYIIGRSASRWEKQHDRLRRLNSEAEFTFIEAEVSTIGGTDDACKTIMAGTSRIDYLCMSMGYLPLVGQIETPEGLEQCFALLYWSRTRFMHNLLPAFTHSPDQETRILTILAGGHEKNLNTTDPTLSQNWSVTNFAHQTTTMTTLALHHLAQQNPNLTLIHAWPGLVRVEGSRKPKPDPETASWLWQWTFWGMRRVMALLTMFKSLSVEESGERHAFLLLGSASRDGEDDGGSSLIAGSGPGVWRVDEFCEVSPRSEALERYCEEGKQEFVWEVTVETWEKALKHGAQA